MRADRPTRRQAVSPPIFKNTPEVPPLTLDEFRAECIAIAAHLLPGCTVKVAEFDLGYKRGVAVQLPNGFRHAVRGYGRTWQPQWRWWRIWNPNCWRRPDLVLALTPAKAIDALAKWAEPFRDAAPINDDGLYANEEPLQPATGHEIKERWDAEKEEIRRFLYGQQWTPEQIRRIQMTEMG